MKTFFDIKNNVFNASGIKNPNICYWESIYNIYYPIETITEDDIHHIIRKFIRENKLPEISLDEIPFSLMTDEQAEKAQWLIDTSFAIQDYWSNEYKKEQEEEQRQTHEYRKHQLGLVSKQSEYSRTIKIISNSDETKWMSISDDEFKAIRDLLTGSEPPKDIKCYLIGNDAVDIYNTGYTNENGHWLTGVDAVIQADEENQILPEYFLYDRAIHTEEYLFEKIGKQDFEIITEEEYKKLA